MNRFAVRSALLSLVGLAGLLLADSPTIAAPDDEDREQIEFFEKHIRPLLVQHCHECHGPKKQEAGLRLDTAAGMAAGSDSGPVVIAGEPDASSLIEAVRYEGEVQMPPDQRLPAAKIEALVAWVTNGAIWPPEAKSEPPKRTGAALFEHARQTHWAYQPIQSPALPAVRDEAWERQPLDRFVLARLEAAGLAPSPAVDRYTYIRRATFDLLGLPPTAAEVADFVADDRPDAYERLVDRLLASPHYGERYGRHWLDVARYADTRGYAFGAESFFPSAYTYRDWVIDALNRDLPYDQFVLRQLAADRLEPEPWNRHLAALGFLTVGRRYRSDPDEIDDRIDVVTRGLLGLTVSCARCHDHKYDAIPTADYYSLYGVFASSEEPEQLPLVGDPTKTPGYADFKVELDKRLAALDAFEQAKHADVVADSRQRVEQYLLKLASEGPDKLTTRVAYISLDKQDLKPLMLTRWRQYLHEHASPDDPLLGPWHKLMKLSPAAFAKESARLIADWKNLPPERINPTLRDALVAAPPQSHAEVAHLYGVALSNVHQAWKGAGGDEAARGKQSAADQQLLSLLLDPGTPTNLPRAEVLETLVRADRNKLRELQKEIDNHISHAKGSPPRAMVLADRPVPVEPHIFLRGQHTRLGDRVPRQFLGVLSPDEREVWKQGSGRLELAQAIIAPDNPLTARVIVNRLWMHHFGEPLVDDPSDFGIRSPPPSHPQLLDYLASGLRDGGWLLKPLHRQLLLSATYRQASVYRRDGAAADPENRLLWRMNRRRLGLEALRDALLVAADRLDPTPGGKAVDIIKSPYSRRRTLYGIVDRQDLPGLYRVFDFASPDQSTARRPRTTVPQQALFLMNSPLAIEQAVATAALPAVQAGEDRAGRIDALYQAIFARSASAEEVAAGETFLAAAIEQGEERTRLKPLAQYAQLLMMTNEFLFID